MSALGSPLAEVGTPATFWPAQAMTHWKFHEFCVVMKRLFVNQSMACPAQISFTNALGQV
jgi:hypothetical protein